MSIYLLHLLKIIAFTFKLGAPNLSILLPGLGGRIVGGENTTIEEHPYMVSVEQTGSHCCGGSILTNRYILSAAHCFG